MPVKIVAGNWKMNTDASSAAELASSIANIPKHGNSRVILIPPFPFIQNVANEVIEVRRIHIGAQNVCAFEKGAYTGEVSAAMLASIQVQYVLVGHSERRSYFNESNDDLYQKMTQAYLHEICPIFCCGETLNIRESGNHLHAVTDQINAVCGLLTEEQIKKTVIAYEPIWAIGTGITATPEQAQEMHAHIRSVISELFNDEIAEEISILYGGSVTAASADALFSQPDIDGGLVGGASLKPEAFIQIIQALDK